MLSLLWNDGKLFQSQENILFVLPKNEKHMSLPVIFHKEDVTFTLV